MIRVLVVDDHAVVRTGLERLLASSGDLDVVAAAANGAEAVELCRQLEPDVVLMDLEMPVLDGIEATRQIVAGGWGAHVVVLTSFSDRERILAALDAGAVGYLLKDAEPEELIRGIKAAARGESPLAAKAATAVLDARHARAPAAELSPREREVLALVGEGLPNKLIALRLGISERTVKTHLTSVFQRIGVTDRTQAALWAARHDGPTRGPTA
jgi:DNA-binding NarL/FixJ family response regulator